MADIFTKRKRSQVMSAIRSTGNAATELKFAAILRAHHVTGWRRHVQIVGKPDFVFQKKKVVVFVDGCFWHGCRWHGRKPDSNRNYWLKKLAQNKKRDAKYRQALRRLGWKVVRFWQHDLKSEERVVHRLLAALKRA